MDRRKVAAKIGVRLCLFVLRSIGARHWKDLWHEVPTRITLDIGDRDGRGEVEVAG